MEPGVKKGVAVFLVAVHHTAGAALCTFSIFFSLAGELLHALGLITFLVLEFYVFRWLLQLLELENL